MGVYDCIKIYCPGCGCAMMAQSKSGPCRLKQYHHQDVRADVALDANRHAPFTCIRCGKEWHFGNIPEIIATVSLTILEVLDD